LVCLSEKLLEQSREFALFPYQKVSRCLEGFCRENQFLCILENFQNSKQISF